MKLGLAMVVGAGVLIGLAIPLALRTVKRLQAASTTADDAAVERALAGRTIGQTPLGGSIMADAVQDDAVRLHLAA
jgi:hypothetical protein